MLDPTVTWISQNQFEFIWGSV